MTSEPKTQEQVQASTPPSVHPAGMTFHEYLKAYDSVEGFHSEWMGLGKGVAIYVSNNTLHQEILGVLHMLLYLYLTGRSLGKVLLAGISMRISDEQPAREPDLMVILETHQDRIKETYLEGPADIAVEIVSPESTERDRGAKFSEYEAAGVTEYWLIDPLRREADVYGLGEDKHYHRLLPDAQGRLISAVLPGFSLDPRLLWQESLPRGAELVALIQQMG